MSWTELSQSDIEAMRPYTLNCADLSAASRAQVRKEFDVVLAKTFAAIVKKLRRDPTQDEANLIAAALVKWFNEERIPYMKPEIVH